MKEGYTVRFDCDGYALATRKSGSWLPQISDSVDDLEITAALYSLQRRVLWLRNTSQMLDLRCHLMVEYTTQPLVQTLLDDHAHGFESLVVASVCGLRLDVRHRLRESYRKDDLPEQPTLCKAFITLDAPWCVARCLIRYKRAE